MIFPHGITVTVQRTTRDRHGDVTSVVEHQIAGCAVAPRSSSEQTDRRDTVIVGLTLFAPFGSDITATDRLVLPDGDVYQVAGQPGAWANPFTGWSPGMEIALERAS